MPNISSIIIDACNIWLYNLVPSILPFYIISDLLINYGFIDILKVILEKPFNKIFKLNGNSIFVIIFSMLTGFPSGAKYISDLLKENLISLEEANKIIKFCHFSNPLFIINIIGVNILGNKLLGYFILISHFLSNFIIALIYRKNSVKNVTKRTFNQEKFSKIFTKSIISASNALLIILGNIITFKILIKILFKYFNFGISKYIISLIIEITSGLFSLKNLSINIYIKALIITSTISFGGLCIHSQVYGILSETKINYKNYLIGRILQALIAPVILLLILFFYRV